MVHELRCYPVLFKVAGVQAGHQLPSFVALKVLLQVVMPGLIVHGRVLRRVLRPVQCGWGRRTLPEAVAITRAEAPSSIGRHLNCPVFGTIGTYIIA